MKYDVGAMTEVDLTDGPRHTNVSGIQIRYQRSAIVGLRVAVGYFSDSREGGWRHLYPLVKDTLRTRRNVRVIEGGSVSGGIELQRQFFKGVYFYAGADVSVGYGTAQQDTQVVDEYYGTSPVFPGSGSYYNTISSNKAGGRGDGFVMSGAVMIGVRLYAGRRFIVGTEFSNPIYYINSRTGDESSRESEFDASVLEVKQRLYLSYRFR